MDNMLAILVIAGYFITGVLVVMAFTWLCGKQDPHYSFDDDSKVLAIQILAWPLILLLAAVWLVATGLENIMHDIYDKAYYSRRKDNDS